jgi:hypothetical protein
MLLLSCPSDDLSYPSDDLPVLPSERLLLELILLLLLLF